MHNYVAPRLSILQNEVVKDVQECALISTGVVSHREPSGQLIQQTKLDQHSEVSFIGDAGCELQYHTSSHAPYIFSMVC